MRGFLKEADNKTGSRRTEISYKADHPGVSQHNMTTPCDSGDTVNEAVFKERICPYPGRSDRQAGRWRNEEIIPVNATDGETGGETSRRQCEDALALSRYETRGIHTGRVDSATSGQRLSGKPGR